MSSHHEPSVRTFKAWRWSQTQLPLHFHTDPHRQHYKRNKAVRVEIFFFAELLPVLFARVFGQNSTGVQRGL